MKAYLKIILSPGFNNNFRQLLAITFTNKAVNEMKERILESLHNFSQIRDVKNGGTLFKELSQELNLKPEELQLRAQKTLKHLLHNYAFFDISTIDKFTHRLIRTFAKDLKLPQNFEVVLDTDLLLDEAINQLISKAGGNKQLTQVLIDFALEKIDDSKSWDIAFDLNKIGRLLFNETHETHIKELQSRKLEDFIELKKDLLTKSLELESQAVTLANSVLQYISECGLEYADFPRETLPNHFKKIAQRIFNPTNLYNNKLEESLINGKILKSGMVLPSEEIATSLLENYLSLKKIIYHIAFLKNAYANSVPLTILNGIQQELKNLQDERAQLPISNFNRIISNEIKNQPAPYIYERLGEKYRHYFIDEFQDTSELQWNNLIPLISNALEGTDEYGKLGSLFLVGDAKQAIYRWRGGRAEQFLNLISLKEQTFVIPPHVEDLPTNYRSKKEIVAFNNNFFTSCSAFLHNPVYHELFNKGNRQNSEASDRGYVQLSFLESTETAGLDDLY
ncbi:MAG: UvrD-helicase domain-containing protein, partial [Flavobacteriaceae bacterium]